ncbi:hypothetical protein CR152_01875 [Massilia violaceinigra]|uniref:Uncharacterized protein n=1 Tax=Massilia violaceinigra TaxID=2045208 RepID=A0A2D2DEI9_9BURK|nr:hypothetical protein [Massilia violaceinigra]ATQ73395.1 hypothetical protein CR152_01875 [Massilia violaceinigra]
MWQVILFNCNDADELDGLLRGLSSIAAFRDGSAFYFYSHLPGQPEFDVDCELITGGLITTRKGAYHLFFGHLIDALTSKFGKLELFKDGELPVFQH